MSAVPPIAVRRLPGLSVTLPHDPHPARCQSCGLHAGGDLVRWVECDPWDQPTDMSVVLCRPCGECLIDAHPRLYREIPPNEPRTGCMGLCVKCAHRRGTRCSHPDAKSNGGAGLEVIIDRPREMHVFCSRGRKGGQSSGWVREWPSPARECVGRLVPPAPSPSGPPNAAPPALAPVSGPIEGAALS
jgi:hypothetical protein